MKKRQNLADHSSANEMKLESSSVSRMNKTRPLDKKRGRWVILAVFLFTLAGSGLIYLQPRAASWWGTLLTRLSGIEGAFRVDDFRSRSLRREFETRTETVDGRWSFWVIDLGSRSGWGEEHAEVYEAVALTRLPTVIAAYQLVDRGEVLLSETVQLTQIDKRLGPGSLREGLVGEKFTLAQLLDLSVREQDVTALAMINRAWGEAMVQEEGLNLDAYRLSRQTPIETGVFWTEVVESEWLGALTSKLFLDSFKEGCAQFSEEGLTDSASGCQFDFGPLFHHGVFLTKNGRSLIVIMSSDSKREDFFDVTRFLLKADLGSE
ncbi:serine hydrolase [Patescibacteria group bacterium]|nr:serine hydrolase [Patescibacteria group bacterium]